jgi:hypothetical protein
MAQHLQRTLESVTPTQEFPRSTTVVLGIFVLHFGMVLFRVVRLVFEDAAIENIWMMQMLLLMLLYNAVEMNTILNGQFLWIYYVAFSVTTTRNRLHSSSHSDQFIVPSIE